MPGRFNRKSEIKNRKSNSRCGSRGLESARRLLDELRKRARLGDGELRQHLAIDLDTGFDQALDEAVVGHAVLAAGRADPGDPQAPEHSLLVAAIAVGVVAALHVLLVGSLEEVLLTAEIPAGGLDDLLMALA